MQEISRMAYLQDMALLPELPCSTPHDNAIIESFKLILTSMGKAQSKVFAMFADVSGSARLFQRIGDTEAAYAVERCVKRMERSIVGFRGETVKISGGELVAAFESAEDACQAAINMQLRVSKLPPVSGLKLTIRIGLHVGVIEAGGAVPSEEIISAARNRAVTGARNIAGLARIDQIVASSLLIRELPKRSAILSRVMADLGRLKEGDRSYDLSEVDWVTHEEQHHRHGVNVDPTPSQILADIDRLCIRYRGKAFLLDEKSPSLTLGRSPASKLLIIDHKASRDHGRIERRGNSYFYIDSSTNGSYITIGTQKELLVRRGEIELMGSGRICFGASGHDPKADCAEFEHL
jgi:class 3 adenylate cyclase